MSNYFTLIIKFSSILADIASAFVAALIQIAGVFTFSVGMHERYLFPAVALGILFDSSKGANSGNYNAIIIFTSLLNVMLFAYLVRIVFDIAIRKKIYSVKTKAMMKPW